ncbi:hypothetical protein Tco_1503680 [Tanacetum coccineum]
MKDQPLPADASPTALSLGYIADSDPEEDEEDLEEDPADYPADGGDNDDNKSSDDDDDDDDVDKNEEDEEKEEHIAPTDPSAVPTDDPVIEQYTARSGMDMKMAKTCYHSHWPSKSSSVPLQSSEQKFPILTRIIEKSKLVTKQMQKTLGVIYQLNIIKLLNYVRRFIRSHGSVDPPKKGRQVVYPETPAKLWNANPGQLTADIYCSPRINRLAVMAMLVILLELLQ